MTVQAICGYYSFVRISYADARGELHIRSLVVYDIYIFGQHFRFERACLSNVCRGTARRSMRSAGGTTVASGTRMMQAPEASTTQAIGCPCGRPGCSGPETSGGFGPVLQGLRADMQARTAGRRAQYDDLVAQAASLARSGADEEAAVTAAIAAWVASAGTFGAFASQELEEVLTEIGRRACGEDIAPACAKPGREVTHVCHVLTGAVGIGGHTRMLTRWIGADSGRRHSVALTRQATVPVPDGLVDAVRAAGGTIRFVDEVRGGLIAQARALRRFVAAADLVVLHIYPFDVVPSLAFAAPGGPPVVFLDHADHTFWLGHRATTTMASMREAGRGIMIRRRGVDPGAIAALPTILDPRERALSRAAAKERLGIDPNTVLLCSVARAPKFAGMGAFNYADLHVPALRRHPNATLLVVGAGEARPDWSAAAADVGGRIVALSERTDVATYFEAADIYVDSFPFVSITSALEAGSVGTPVVSIFPYGECARVLGNNMAGIDDGILLCRDPEAYTATLSRLITDASSREAHGERLREDIRRHHTGAGWLAALEALYARAMAAPRPHWPAAAIPPPGAEDLDNCLQLIVGGRGEERYDLSNLLRGELGLLPLKARLRHWRRLLGSGHLAGRGRFGPLVFLLPEWMKTRLGRLRRRLKGDAAKPAVQAPRAAAP
ncbi:glycosyltransferase family 4 protein [Roseomonas sp. HJA6]|uniref:Glycosyltransferase family 4 protein n=1 Tax=Roseomonas alba TaxID=2846776 RepID=A0ABS7A5H2_9PROT|nr:glycosyltransferase family 4 protein [Neoroseomonas alba]MBW6397525.1 glycosyltransferase family 4 protein [Neoroseomonas alba]